MLYEESGKSRTGIRRFFVVEGYEEVAVFLKKWSFDTSKKRVIRSMDFSTMYTSVPHSNLKLALKKAFFEAWEYEAEKIQAELDQVLSPWKGPKHCVFTKTTNRYGRKVIRYSCLHLRSSLN